eukprot:325120-Chlamydomonas_euryale.AAC.3
MALPIAPPVVPATEWCPARCTAVPTCRLLQPAACTSHAGRRTTRARSEKSLRCDLVCLRGDLWLDAHFITRVQY